MPRGSGTETELPSESTGRRYRYCCAATPNANVLTASSRPADAQRAESDERGEAGDEQRRDRDGEQERHRVDMEVEELVVTPPDAERETTRERRSEQRAETREGHLPE